MALLLRAITSQWWPSLYTILWLESLARHLEPAGWMSSCRGSFGYHRTNHWNSGRHLHDNVSYWHASALGGLVLRFRMFGRSEGLSCDRRVPAQTRGAL
jgi:hypothetical protein